MIVIGSNTSDNGKSRFTEDVSHFMELRQNRQLALLKRSAKNDYYIQFFFLKFLADTGPFLGPLVPLFWISGDVSSGFQSQSGFCLIRYFCGGKCNVLHSNYYKVKYQRSRVAGTMVARSFSVWVIAIRIRAKSHLCWCIWGTDWLWYRLPRGWHV